MLNGLLSSLFGSLFGASAASAARAEGGGGEEPVLWVVVLIASNPVEEQIAVARLSDEGIPSRTRREAAGQAYGLTVGILGQVEVLVPEPLKKQAKRVLSDTMAIPLEEFEEEDDEAP